MRFIPWLYDLFMLAAERAGLGDLRSELVAPARGPVLEVGAGTGLNFPHYSPGTFVVATDLDPDMLSRASIRARASAAHVALVAADAELLPFRDSEFESGVVGLSLCTISDPGVAIQELKRVLRAEASLYLLEHVRKDTGVTGHCQDWLTPAWRRIAGGCHLNRRTDKTVEANGFHIENISRYAGGLVLLMRARSS